MTQLIRKLTAQYLGPADHIVCMDVIRDVGWKLARTDSVFRGAVQITRACSEGMVQKEVQLFERRTKAPLRLLEGARVFAEALNKGSAADAGFEDSSLD